MLSELHIENFAIIEKLDLNFSAGLMIFTGETGAGKSILIDAVETLLGGRADAAQVRSQSERASVEGVFRFPAAARTALHSLLSQEDLLDDPDYVVLGREIRLNGRNVARVNGRIVSAALLREIGEQLVDVHGQSEHLSLLKVSQHLFLLDRFAGVETELGDYRQTHQLLQQTRRALAELRQAEKDAARRSDTLLFQISEIEAAHLKADEEDSLKDERNRLANAEGLASLVQEALVALDEGSPEAPAATDLLGQVAHALNSLARLDPSQAQLNEQAAALSESLSELSRELHAYHETIEFNPRRLDQVEERLGLLHNLKRKYGDTLEEVLAYAAKASQELEAITHAGERIQELEAKEEELLQQLGRQGELLSQRRHAQAKELARRVENELSELHMSSARFQVDFQQRPDPNGAPLASGQRVAFDSHGLEKVEFLIAPNPGEGFKPLVKIASGGETSRLMLALKNVLAKADQVPTLIFDEIDQGIGGRVGTVVGQKLWSLANQHQVLCVTHLPQLAAFGQKHFHVTKLVQEGRTSTQVEDLQGEARLLELAQMFGEISQGTLQSAKDLLDAVQHKAGSTVNHTPPPR